MRRTIIVQCNQSKTPSEYFGPFKNEKDAREWIRIHEEFCSRRHFTRILHDWQDGVRLGALVG